MIENSPEHFGWSAMCREANGCFPTREAFMKGLAAYEAARAAKRGAVIDQESEAFKAAWAAKCDTQGKTGGEVLVAILEAYEAARPKLPTITGLPEMVDGRRIVGWKWAVPSPPSYWGWCHIRRRLDHFRSDYPCTPCLIAITEATSC